MKLIPSKELYVMKIILDVMSGDNAPLELIKGASLAVSELDCEIVMVSDEEVIKKCAEDNSIDISSERLSIRHTTEIITMEDHPLSVRTKKDSSMAVGLHMLHDDEGDAFVSAGNTGALYAGASLIVMRIKGFRKAAIAAILPFQKPMLLVDSGANTVVTDENLEQFAVMGSIYMEKIFGIERPEVGLLNNGTEETKGTEVVLAAYKRLSECPDINFVGNIEGKTVPFGSCDVLVTDGFTGNVLLKFTEGFGSFMLKKLKTTFTKNVRTKLSALALSGEVKELKKEFDASEYGGAPLLGISKPVIKAHGSSDANAIKNAVRQAVNYSETGIIFEIAKHIMNKNSQENPNNEN